MDEFDDLGEYNGNAVHDAWVDYDYQLNTGENVSGQIPSDDEDDTES